MGELIYEKHFHKETIEEIERERIDFVEAFGEDAEQAPSFDEIMKKIYSKEYGLREPELIDMGSDFRINLYRKDAATDQNGVIDPKERNTDDTNDTKVEPNDTNEEAILRILRSNPKATQKDVVEMLGVSLATVKRLMNSLQKAGKIKRKGSNRSGSWVVIDQKE